MTPVLWPRVDTARTEAGPKPLERKDPSNDKLAASFSNGSESCLVAIQDSLTTVLRKEAINSSFHLGFAGFSSFPLEGSNTRVALHMLTFFLPRGLRVSR